jgi:hypothetical protein
MGTVAILEHAMTPLGPGVRFPAMREEVQYAVFALSDEGYQDRVWHDNELPGPGYVYSFDMACHALLDDTSLLGDPKSMIGDVLVSSDELDALLRLSKALLEVIEEIGTTGTYEDARRSATWSEVVGWATDASELLGRPSSFP